MKQYDAIFENDVKTAENKHMELQERKAKRALRRKQQFKKKNCHIDIFTKYGDVYSGWYDEARGIVKRSHSSRLRTYYKKFSNKKIRNLKPCFEIAEEDDESSERPESDTAMQKTRYHPVKGSQYRKIFDYWWNIE